MKEVKIGDPEFSQKIKDVNLELIDFIEKWGDDLEPYEVGFALINRAVSMLLATAPDHLVALKTIVACVESGISEYQQTYEQHEENKTSN